MKQFAIALAILGIVGAAFIKGWVWIADGCSRVFDQNRDHEGFKEVRQ